MFEFGQQVADLGRAMVEWCMGPTLSALGFADFKPTLAPLPITALKYNRICAYERCTNGFHKMRTDLFI